MLIWRPSTKRHLYCDLKKCNCNAWISIAVAFNDQIMIKRLKQTPGETSALEKEVKLVYFPNLIPVIPSGAFAFEDVPLCEVCSFTPWVMAFCPPLCPDLDDPVSRDRINCWPAAVAANHTPPPIPHVHPLPHMHTQTTNLPPFSPQHYI